MAKKPKKMNPNSLANLEKGKWPPGKSGNPNGRPKSLLNKLKETLSMSQDEVIGGKLDKSDYQAIALWLMELSQDQLKKLVKDDKTPAVVIILARAIQRDMSKGGLNAFDNIYKKFIEEKESNAAQVIFMTGFDLGENNPIQEEPEIEENEETEPKKKKKTKK